MRVLLLTLGSRGDVQPYVALGAVLAERGHDVTISTGQGFDTLITAQGLTSAPLSVDVRAMLKMPDVQAAMRSLRGRVRAMRTTKALMQRQLDDMWAVTQEVAPDVIVYHPKTFIAPILARALGAIAIPSFLQPAFVATGAFATPLAPLPPLGRLGNTLSHRILIALMRLGCGTMLRPWLRRHLEVPARPGLDTTRGYHPAGRPVPRLHAHSPQLVPKPADWGHDDHITGAWVTRRDRSWDPPAGLTAFLASGPPPVYVGFGSMPSAQAERTAAVVVGSLTRTKTRAVLATGWGALAEAATTKDIHVLDDVPHDWLFPRCRAVVHHGGAGTTQEGLRWGRPTLVCPVLGDQPFWGRVVLARGAGPAPLRLNDLDEERFSAALLALRSPKFAAAASALGDCMRQETGAETAADLIEASVAEC